ncbi:MAG: heparinase, partial [Calditrichaeota bacterium]
MSTIKMHHTVWMVLALFTTSLAAEHPSLLITAQEARQMQQALGRYPLFDKTFRQIKAEMDSVLQQPIDVPPPGEAGGYEHERHKQNYREMQKAGVLFAITGDKKYAEFVKNMLLRYAKMYPTLG